MSSPGRRAAVAARTRCLLLAAATASALTLTGCGLIGGGPSDIAHAEMTKPHLVTLTVNAPTGSTVEYGVGNEAALTAQVDSTGQWMKIVDAPGITSVHLAVTPNSLFGANASADCAITIAGKSLDQSSTMPGMGGSIECKASTVGA